MSLFFSRLPHVLTTADLVDLLTPTYARENGVSDELAHERMAQVLKSAGFTNRIYEAISSALAATQESRTQDAVVDALSKAVPKHRNKMPPAASSSGLSAVTVSLNIEIGLAPLNLRQTLESERGRELLDQGFAALGKHLVRELVG
jgi:hypothetical protein